MVDFFRLWVSLCSHLRILDVTVVGSLSLLQCKNSISCYVCKHCQVCLSPIFLACQTFFTTLGSKLKMLFFSIFFSFCIKSSIIFDKVMSQPLGQEAISNLCKPLTRDKWVRKLCVGHVWRLFESWLAKTPRTVNQLLGFQFSPIWKFFRKKAHVKEKGLCQN